MKQLKFPCMGLVAFFMLFVPLFGQKTTAPEYLTQDLPNIPYIFEGEILRMDIYLGDQDGNRLPWGTDVLPDGSPAIAYSSTIVQVCKIYKGKEQITHGTVEMVHRWYGKAFYSPAIENPAIKQYRTIEKDGLWFNYADEDDHFGHGGVQGTFFLSSVFSRMVFFATDGTIHATTGAQCTNAFKIDLYKKNYAITYSKVWFDMMKMHKTKGWGISKDAKDNYATGFDQQFKNDTAIKCFMCMLGGLDADAPNYCTTWTDSLNRMEPEPTNFIEQKKIDYSVRKQNYDAWMLNAQKVMQLDRPKTTLATNLILDIASPRLAGTPAEYYLEYDVMVSATDNATYLDRCLLWFHYNTSVFGSNVAANNNITITKGPAFASSTYEEPSFIVTDINTDTVAIPMGTDFSLGSWSRTAVTIFPVKLMTIRLTIQNCDQLSEVFHGDPAHTAILSYYTVNANDEIFDGLPYVDTDYSGAINDPMCQPIIESFTNYVPAGTGNTVNISGRYFGTLRFDGNVIFTDADEGNVFPPPTSGNFGGLDRADVDVWMDDQIILTLPGIVDSIETIPGGLHYQATPGSGYFKVRNFTDTYGISNDRMTIPYAIQTERNSVPPFEKRKVAITGPDAGNGYVMHCTADVETKFPGVKAVIIKAMRDWSCASGINITLGNDVVGFPSQDNVSLITVGVLPPNTVMRTQTNVDACNSGVPNFFLRSFDIVIDTTFTWNTDTLGDIQMTEADFYKSIAHEIGHGHLLRHINDSVTDIMFYYDPSVFVAESMRKKVWGSPGAMGGSIYTTGSLILDVSTCVPLHIVYHPDNCVGISVEEVGDNVHELNVWPNPTGNHGTISIAFNLDQGATTQFFLYNALGQLVRLTEMDFAEGTVQYELPISDLPTGAYFITLRINGNAYTAKFIKTA